MPVVSLDGLDRADAPTSAEDAWVHVFTTACGGHAIFSWVMGLLSSIHHGLDMRDRHLGGVHVHLVRAWPAALLPRLPAACSSVLSPGRRPPSARPQVHDGSAHVKSRQVKKKLMEVEGAASKQATSRNKKVGNQSTLECPPARGLVERPTSGAPRWKTDGRAFFIHSGTLHPSFNRPFHTLFHTPQVSGSNRPMPEVDVSSANPLRAGGIARCPHRARWPAFL